MCQQQDVEKLSDVKAVVGQLYETLNCQEYNSVLEREVMAQLEQVMIELEPLEMVSKRIDKKTKNVCYNKVALKY